MCSSHDLIRYALNRRDADVAPNYTIYDDQFAADFCAGKETTSLLIPQAEDT